MADIQLHQFPNAQVPASQQDFLYISQNSADKKITIAELADQFELVDIFGLQETTQFDNGDFVAITDVSVGVNTDANRKVTAKNMSDYFQENQHYQTRTYFGLDDTEIVYRSGNAFDNLSQITARSLRDQFLNITNLTQITSPIDSDIFLLSDLSVTGVNGRAKKLTLSNLRKSILNTRNLNPITKNEIEGLDIFNIYDISTNQAKKLTYNGLLARIVSDTEITNYVTTDTAQAITGQKTFNSAIRTNNIVERTGGNGVTINSVLLRGNTVTATTLYGQLRPKPTLGSFLDSETLTIDYARSVSEYYNDALTDLREATGNFLTVGGNNNGDLLTYGRSGIIPRDSGVSILGSADRQWEAVYTQNVYCSNDAIVRDDLYVGQGTSSGSLILNGTAISSASSILNSAIPTASTSRVGIVGLASQSDVPSGTNNTKALTAASLGNNTYTNSSPFTSYIVGGRNQAIRVYVTTFNWCKMKVLSARVVYDLSSGAPSDYSGRYTMTFPSGFSFSNNRYSFTTGGEIRGNDSANDLDSIALASSSNSAIVFSLARRGNIWQTETHSFMLMGF